MERVASFAQYNRLTSLMFRTQSRMNDINVQIASGKTSQDYKGIARDSERLVSLEATHVRVTQFVRGNDGAERTLNTMESNIAQVFDVMSDFKVLLINALNADNAKDLNMGDQTQKLMDQVVSLLNVQENGRYLFSGSMTNTPPVDTSVLPAVYAVPTSDWDSIGYYQGDAQQHVIRAAENFDITYGVNAGELGFERAIRAMDATLKGGPTDRANLEQALVVTNQALNDIPDIRTRVGTSRGALADTNVRHQEFLLFAEETFSEIENVDLPKAVTLMNSAQVNLEASYMSLSRLSELSLMNFLR